MMTSPETRKRTDYKKNTKNQPPGHEQKQETWRKSYMFLISVLANRAQWSETGGACTTLMEVMTKSKQMVNLHTHHTRTSRTIQRVRLCFKHETTKVISIS